MTILNQENDGLYPELIVLARAAFVAPHSADDLVSICEIDNPKKLRAALSRWTTLGLFEIADERVVIARSVVGNKREGVDAFTERLPHICRRLALLPIHCEPLWEDVGQSSDLARALAWLLAQDIHNLPSTWKGGADNLVNEQVPGKSVFQNDTRWNGARFWSRYLGFASGPSSDFVVDPTEAVRHELRALFTPDEPVDAQTFAEELARAIPVLDGGVYRREMESCMDMSLWRPTASGQLSMSLSFALRRLQLEGTLVLEHRADTQQGLTLTGKGYVPTVTFSHVRVTGTSE